MYVLPMLVYDSSSLSRFPVQCSVQFSSRLIGVFFLYSALFLLQPTGQSDGNSPGEMAGKHRFKKRLRLHEPKKISLKTSQKQNQ